MMTGVSLAVFYFFYFFLEGGEGGLVVESRGVDRLGLMLWIIRLVFDNTSTFLVEVLFRVESCYE
jgi:hypothetical protein